MNEKLPDVSDKEKLRDKFIKDKKKYDGPVSEKIDEEIKELDIEIAQGHDYHFIGKIGRFCPIKPGKGGGILVREQNGKFNSASGAKGYRWLESEMVKELNLKKDIDRSYYDNLVNEAVDAISQYGDFEWFVSND